MFKVLFVKGRKTSLSPPDGFLWREIPWGEDLEERLVEEAPDLVLLAPRDLQRAVDALKALRTYSRERPLPVILLGGGELLRSSDLLARVEDFLLEGASPLEVRARIERTLRRTYWMENRELIRCGDLAINLSKREVTLKGEPLSLTFKEYELLRFLAANRGRVFSREALLNRIWGYDYYGGERTVDVHIRRLRAKIEVGGRSFIETVRGVGYRFKEGC